MAKQIIISQGDRGIPFSIKLIDSTKEPVSIGADSIKVHIVKPDGTDVERTDVAVTDNVNGIFEFLLTTNETDIVGNYSIYIELSNSNYDIVTTSAVNYYVQTKHGGV